MTKSTDRSGCVITVHGEDGSSRDVKLSAAIAERLLAGWSESGHREPACLRESLEHVAHSARAVRRDAEAE